MKKFQLIKNYPGFEMPDECRNIDRSNSTSNIYETTGGQEVWYPERHPEFWEPIVEKEYEIVTFVNKGGHILNKLPNGLFNGTQFHYDEEQCLIDYPIHSIKRLSDGEIFTVGDSVEYTGRRDWANSKIKEFIINVTNLCIVIQQGHNTGHYYCLDKFEKAKKPLFTTVDGVGLYENDSFFSAHLENGTTTLAILKLGASQEYAREAGYLWFSTKQKAIDYIIENKPCLSIKDIKPLFGAMYLDDSPNTLDRLSYKLELLVRKQTKL